MSGDNEDGWADDTSVCHGPGETDDCFFLYQYASEYVKVSDLNTYLSVCRDPCEGVQKPLLAIFVWGQHSATNTLSLFAGRQRRKAH